MARRGAESKKVARRGLMFVLSSPSGAGKTTLSRMLLRADRQVELSVSVTTRPKRPRRNRRPRLSFYRSRPLRCMVKNGELLEWAEVFGHRYGTPRQPVDQGAAGRPRCLVRHRLAGHATTPRKSARRSRQRLHPAAHREELERRLKRRAQDSKAVIVSRMAKAAGEMSHWPEYDYVIVNRDKAEAFAGSAGDPRGGTAQARAADRPFRFRARAASEAVSAPHIISTDFRRLISPPARTRCCWFEHILARTIFAARETSARRSSLSLDRQCRRGNSCARASSISSIRKRIR